MGFFQGVVAQLNTIDERNERFAKEERDRAERRKELQARLRETRMQNLLKVAAQRGIVGGLPTSAVKPGSGGLPTDITPSPSTGALRGHFTKMLLKDMKASPEALAPFAALGEDNMKEIFDQVNTARKLYQEAGREAEFTPDVVNNILKDTRVTVEEGGTVKYDDLLEMAGLTDLTEEERKYLDFVLQRGPSARVTFLGSNKPSFFTLDDYDKLDKAFVGAITQTLIRKQKELQRSEPTTDEERVSRADSLRTIERQIEDAKDGVVGFDVIEAYGPETFVELAAIKPKLLQQKILPGNLGAARRAYEKSQTAMPTYGTVEEAMAARQRGDIKVGDKIIVAGQTTTVKK